MSPTSLAYRSLDSEQLLFRLDSSRILHFKLRVFLEYPANNRDQTPKKSTLQSCSPRLETR